MKIRTCEQTPSVLQPLEARQVHMGFRQMEGNCGDTGCRTRFRSGAGRSTHTAALRGAAGRPGFPKDEVHAKLAGADIDYHWLYNRP